MDDDEWNDIDFRVKALIILSLSDEILYNIMNEETIAGRWCRLKSFYMMKSLSNKFFMKKQLCNLQMKECTLILHFNAINKILRDLLALKVKSEEDKALLLLSSLLLSYDHLATTIMYAKKILELEVVKQVFQNNKLMKKTNSTDKTSGLVVKSRRG